MIRFFSKIMENSAHLVTHCTTYDLFDSNETDNPLICFSQLLAPPR